MRLWEKLMSWTHDGFSFLYWTIRKGITGDRPSGRRKRK